MYSSPALPVPQDVLQRRNVQFTREAWKAGVRPDQRTAHQMRELDITFALLSREVVQVQLGNTVILATTACELVEALPNKPKHGFFHIQVRRPAHERDGAATQRSTKQLTVFLNRLFRGGVVDTEGLCVLPGRRVWSIAVDVHILNDAGNVFDAAQWAVLVALQHERRPELTIRGDEVVIHSPQERDPVPLSLHHLPLCFTFAVTFDERRRQLEAYTAKLRQGRVVAGGGSSGAMSAAVGPSSHVHRDVRDAHDVSHMRRAAAHDAAAHSGAGAEGEAYRWLCHGDDEAVMLVVDPSEEECAAAATTVTVAVNAEGQVCAMQKGEGCDISWHTIQSCVKLAKTLSPQVLQVMQTAMSAHDGRRQAATRGQFLWAQSRTGVGMAKSSSDAS